MSAGAEGGAAAEAAEGGHGDGFAFGGGVGGGIVFEEAFVVECIHVWAPELRVFVYDDGGHHDGVSFFEEEFVVEKCVLGDLPDGYPASYVTKDFLEGGKYGGTFAF